DVPGRCPICQMTLRPEEPVAPPGARRILYYRSPHDPSVRSPTPAKDGMGMDFVPVYADDAADAASAVPGRGSVALTSERRQLLGLTSALLTEVEATREVHTVGRVAVDERRVGRVYAKAEGYVERLLVDFAGQPVRRGQPLLELYSPELLAAQGEYLLAVRARAATEGTSISGLAAQGADLLAAARRRLELLDVPADQIARLEAGGEPSRTVTLHAQLHGVVTRKTVNLGSRVTPGEPLFEVADLDRVWVLADVYEQDQAVARVGTPAQLRARSLPDLSWTGKVTFVMPELDPVSRTLKVRLEIANPGQALKPEMFVDVVLQGERTRSLVVPESAVLDSGARRIVFLDLGDGRYEPREVALGARSTAGFTVRSGLVAGDRVVTSGNFLLDSESSLKAALR
ncbi:MAG TPA: efflux RND transporter periplasmic adaptor subunit, partial [Vicinamibacteria bacterium]